MQNGNIIGGVAGYVKSVQSGTIAIAAASASNTATITSVDVNNAVLLFLGFTVTNAFTRQDVSIARLALTNATTITATRGLAAASGETITVSYMIVEFSPGLIKSVQQATIALSAVSNTATITAVDTTKAVIIPLGMSSADTTVSPTTDVTSFKLVLTNATTVTANHITAAAAAYTIGFTVVEFV